MLFSKLILEESDWSVEESFYFMMLKFTGSSAELTQLIKHIFKFFLFIPNFSDRLSRLNPFFPLFIFEFLNLLIRLIDIFWSLPETEVVLSGFVSQTIVHLDVVFRKVFMRLFWELSVSISDSCLSKVGIVPDSDDFTEYVDFLFVAFRPSYC